MITTRLIIQAISFACALGGVVMLLRYLQKHWTAWPYVLPPLSWLVHVAIFYAAVILNRTQMLSIEIEFGFWSAVVHLHAVFLIAGGAWLIMSNRMMDYYHDQC